MAPSTTIRRLLKEVAELSPGTSNPNPAFHAAPVSDSDLHEWHFTLLGPPSPSPYAGGLYHGRISLPAQYPLKPPNFRFLTPSGRFEVNREICLSISGFHEETWMPAWGVRTALTALRSFMAEPGTAGQVGGLEAGDEVRKRLANESKSWKCNDCGKTNSAVMDEWWLVCREKGVKVDEEGIGLEALPDGMAVEAIDRSNGKAKIPNVSERSDTKTTQTTTQASMLGESIAESKQDTSMSSEEQTFQTRPQPDTSVDSSLSESTSGAASQATSTSTSASTLSSTKPSHPPPSPSLQSSQPTQSIQPTTSIPASVSQVQQRLRDEDQPVITLDRAITAVFLALCLMILKKIFYPASQGGFSGANDDWDIGLRKEY